jgi:tRNA (guanine-N7-)-methyltransferase
MSEEQVHPKHRLYGRAAGKPLSKTQTARIETLLPQLAIPDGALAPLDLFGGTAGEAWLEIGFGGGEHLAGQAAKHPDVGFLGAEPFLEGVAKLLSEIEHEKLGNVRVRRGDARDLV